MSTKNNPGRFDCYSKAAPDEPMFVLLGRDPIASLVVTFWVKMRLLIGAERITDDKLVEASKCAREMESWAVAHGEGVRVKVALDAFKKLVQIKSRTWWRRLLGSE